MKKMVISSAIILAVVIFGYIILQSGIVEKTKFYLSRAPEYNEKGLKIEKEEGSLEEAIQAFKEAISRYPHYAEPHYNLARIFYKRAKDQQKAVKKAKLELKNPTKKMFFEEAVRLSAERARDNMKRVWLFSVRNPLIMVAEGFSLPLLET